MTTAITPRALPASLPKPTTIPAHTELRGRASWVDAPLAEIRQPAGFNPQTGAREYRTTIVEHAPYPSYRDVVRLPKETSFRDVIAMAQAVACAEDPSGRYSQAQAVLQSEAGNWYITMAGERESDDHTEPLRTDWSAKARITSRQPDLVAIVDGQHWANFTPRRV